MTVEKSESAGLMAGEGAWTKLLSETPSDASESTVVDSVGGGDSCFQQKASEDDAPLRCQSQHQLLECHGMRYSEGQVEGGRIGQERGDETGGSGNSSGSVSICVDKDDTETTRLHSLPSGEKGVPIHRKESILGTFNKHLRRSLKAVSESPGPITR